MITTDNLDEVLDLIEIERGRFVYERGFDVSRAKWVAVEVIARQMGIGADEFREKVRAIRALRREERQREVWGKFSSVRNQSFLARHHFWHTHPKLFEAILRILFQHDPVRICDHDAGATEYSLEVNTILPRLGTVRSLLDVHQIVVDEFVRWFGRPEKARASVYEPIANEIWELLKTYKGQAWQSGLTKNDEEL